VASTKRRRQTKHRGNAAGVVESRGRTGRPPTTAEKGGKGAKGRAGSRKGDPAIPRADRPPTWTGAFYRAMIAAVLMLLIGILLIKNSSEAIALFPIVLAAYVPIS